jgi:hypothetical protein
MFTPLRLRVAAALVTIALPLALTACGGSSDKTSAHAGNVGRNRAPVANFGTSTAPASPSPASPNSPAAGSQAPTGDSDFCTRFRAESAGANVFDPNSFTDPKKLRAEIAQAVADAPGEIKADVSTLADAATKVLDQTGGHGTDDPAAVEAAYANPKVQAAMLRFVDYVSTHCGAGALGG